MPETPTDSQERFWAKVDKTSDCWVWTASRNNYGYGKFCSHGRTIYAHRFAYEQFVGPIPAGMLVDHVCHNRACVNPSHLRIATRKQNMENRAGATRNGRSGVRGVTWHEEAQKWRAQVKHEGRSLHFGFFDSIAEAAVVAKAKRNELFTHNNADREDH